MNEGDGHLSLNATTYGSGRLDGLDLEVLARESTIPEGDSIFS
jgi:hypothetical protein